MASTTDNKHATTRSKRNADVISADGSFPTRDCDHLWASHRALDCAMNLCIPCAYKIGCFDVALDTEFCQRVPNQRPEMCPRSSKNATVVEDGTLGYRKGLKVLTLGDGDFSFSLALARLGVILTATSYEDLETLERVYPGVNDTIDELRRLDAKIYYKVDATRIQETLPDHETANEKYDRIVWNFPCSAIAKGQDGQNKEMDFNKELVRGFFRNVQRHAADGCQLHMNHKTKPPFNHWRIEEVALDLNTDGQGLDFHYVGRIVLDRCLFPPYVPRKALDRKSFPVHDACTYVFSLETMDMKDACAVNDSDLVRVTTTVIQSIRDLHLHEGALSPKNKHKKVNK